MGTGSAPSANLGRNRGLRGKLAECFLSSRKTKRRRKKRKKAKRKLKERAKKVKAKQHRLTMKPVLFVWKEVRSSVAIPVRLSTTWSAYLSVRFPEASGSVLSVRLLLKRKSEENSVKTVSFFKYKLRNGFFFLLFLLFF